MYRYALSALLFAAACQTSSPGEPLRIPPVSHDGSLCYAGFCVDTERPGSDLVRVAGQKRTLQTVRDATAALIAADDGPMAVTMDMNFTEWGRGSGTGRRLIEAGLAAK